MVTKLANITRRTFIEASVVVTAALPLREIGWLEARPLNAISFVCAHPAGCLADRFARAMSVYITEKVAQPVVVRNKPGAGGALAVQSVKATLPDGYTLMFAITATISKNGVLYKNLPDEPNEDFVPVACIAASNMGYICVVGPADIPDNIVKWLSALIVEGTKTDHVQELLETYGADGPAFGHEEFKKLCTGQGPIWISSILGLGLIV